MKFDNKGKERTDAYVGTFDTFCVEDMLVVETIKTYVKNMNKELANYGAVDKRGMNLDLGPVLKQGSQLTK
jgi:hypothetical protein